MAEQEANPETYEAIDWASMQNTGYSGMPQNENGLRYQALCRGDAEVVANQTVGVWIYFNNHLFLSRDKRVRVTLFYGYNILLSPSSHVILWCQ